LQSLILKNMSFRTLTTAYFPEILSGETCGLPFLQEFRLYRPANCPFLRKTWLCRPATCLYFLKPDDSHHGRAISPDFLYPNKDYLRLSPLPGKIIYRTRAGDQ
jgi:hypothetical protein